MELMVQVLLPLTHERFIASVKDVVKGEGSLCAPSQILRAALYLVACSSDTQSYAVY